jgi:hypothetical protein
MLTGAPTGVRVNRFFAVLGHRADAYAVNASRRPHPSGRTKDASDFAAFFKAQEGRSYRKVEAKLLPVDVKNIDVID